mmetsp:Transcript_5498/g.12180  ORF Transcript_5498/g.12180 Transcript_5498/m.12180 type:complete len:212 (-) Transcript_5498:2476-3111(-)
MGLHNHHTRLLALHDALCDEVRDAPLQPVARLPRPLDGRHTRLGGQPVQGQRGSGQGRVHLPQPPHGQVVHTNGGHQAGDGAGDRAQLLLLLTLRPPGTPPCSQGHITLHQRLHSLALHNLGGTVQLNGGAETQEHGVRHSCQHVVLHGVNVQAAHTAAPHVVQHAGLAQRGEQLTAACRPSCQLVRCLQHHLELVIDQGGSHGTGKHMDL